MTKQQFLQYCRETYGTVADYPFDDWMESAVLRHSDTRKWYAITMTVSQSKLNIDGDEQIDIVNLKLPNEMIGSFGIEDGVYPAYHMNKLHWLTLALDECDAEMLRWLLDISYDLTRRKIARKR